MATIRTHRYTSDRPNKPPAPDLLGRDRFAERLADDIRAWDGSDSIVIALFGSWGSGKTSLKERVVANLRSAASDWPILDFNPWQFSGSGSITIPFFRELDVILKTGRAGKDSEEASIKLKRYSSHLSLLGTIAKFVTPFGLLHSAEAAAGAAAAAEALQKMANVAEQGGQALEQEVGSKTATDIKKELAEAMAGLDRPILVVIDDIDRLTTAEILEVFQLVKVNADLPNIIYLLLFDRPVVSKALDKVSEGRGGQYLEKIVQVAYHIPQARPDKIRDILFAGIDEILGANDAEVRWNVNRWSDVYLEGMAPYFRNLRHAYRFLASLFLVFPGAVHPATDLR
jgi:predicted KAP-like P-loop ATPase